MTTSVLFLGTQNAVRSQLAEALLRKHGGDQFEVYSAGLDACELHPYTAQVLQEVGVDTSKMHVTMLRDIMGHRRYDFGIIVCRRAEAACPTIADANHLHHWIFDNPAESEGSEAEKLAKFRETRDKIEARIKLWLAESAEEHRLR